MAHWLSFSFPDKSKAHLTLDPPTNFEYFDSLHMTNWHIAFSPRHLSPWLRLQSPALLLELLALLLLLLLLFLRAPLVVYLGRCLQRMRIAISGKGFPALQMSNFYSSGEARIY